MYNVLLYTSKMQEDKIYNIYNFDLMNNSILLLYWSHCIACMLRARPWLVTGWRRDWWGTEGNSWSPMLIPRVPSLKQ